MRQKFGSSSGLTSNGRMAGIGSDPNYRADGPESESIIDFCYVTVPYIFSVFTMAAAIYIMHYVVSSALSSSRVNAG